MKRVVYFLLLLVVMVGCDNNKTITYQTIDTNFTWGNVKSYGAFYDSIGIPSNVFSLDLYSTKLGFDSLGYIIGTGTNLYFSDIFLEPTCSTLAVGEYQNDTTGAAYTFLPGVNYEGSFSGAYLLVVGETSYSVDLIPQGTFTLTQTEDSTFISFTLVRQSTTRVYEASFRGVLPYEDMCRSEIRKSHLPNKRQID